MFSYTVRLEFEDPSLVRETLEWLQAGHVREVLEAGAEDAEVVVVDGTLAVECRYRFASREAFAAYERDHAPRLRAEGLAFVAGRGVRFTRTTGEIVERQEGLRTTADGLLAQDTR